METDWIAEDERLSSGRRAHGSAGGRPPTSDQWAPPLSEQEVREAERELGIAFPESYRRYLLRMSAGGHDRIAVLQKDERGWGWRGDTHTNHLLLGTAFPHPDSYRDEDHALDRREPQEEDYPDLRTFQEAWKIWDAECGVFEEHKTAGAVYLQIDGIGYTLLVVTGPHRGCMFYDNRACSEVIEPLNRGGSPVTFEQWIGALIPGFGGLDAVAAARPSGRWSLRRRLG